MFSRIRFRFVAMIIFGSFTFHDPLFAEDPIEAQRRALGGGSINNDGGGVIVAPPTPKPQTKIVYYTSVSPARQWKAADGRMMVGRLMAFSAPKPGETGAVEVIKNGNVRFLRSGAKAPVEFPLEKLSEEDQKYVKGIAKAAKNGPPKAPAPEKKEMAEKPSGSQRSDEAKLFPIGAKVNDFRFDEVMVISEMPRTRISLKISGKKVEAELPHQRLPSAPSATW